MKMLLVISLLSFLCLKPVGLSQTTDVPTISSAGMSIKGEVLATGLGIPWGFDFLSKQEIIVTSRSGQMYLVNPKTRTSIKLAGLPAIYSRGQGGLLDVIKDPQFPKNRRIFFSYSIVHRGGNSVRLASAILKKNRLTKLKILFTAEPESSKNLHFGSRLAIDSKNFLFMTIGDRGERDRAQQLNNHGGKIIRLKLDGSIPKDNPFYNRKDSKPEIWSYGHRNPQGLTIHPITKELCAQEHGPRGGDEINIVKKGKNYGWPKASYGKEYWGPSIGSKKVQGTVQPLYQFTPSIAPSGLAIYSGTEFPKWEGNIFSGAMKLTHINRLVMKKGKIIQEERLLDKWYQRVRNVKVGPKGHLYFTIDDGALIRLYRTSK